MGPKGDSDLVMKEEKAKEAKEELDAADEKGDKGEKEEKKEKAAADVGGVGGEGDEEAKKQVKRSFIKMVISKISIEPAVILMSLGFCMFGVQISNLYIEKTCKVGSYFFGNGTTYPDEVCDNLFNGSFPDEQEAVQKVVADVEMYSNLIKQIPQVIFALFLGPWSDRAGRKMLIMLPYFGYFLVCVSMIANVYFFDELYVEFMWLENVSAIFGSWVIFFIGCYGYMADTTSPESRTIRIAIMDGCFFAMDIIGNYINGPIYKRFDYYGSFGAGAICYALGFLIVLLTFKDPKKKNGEPTTETKGRSVVSLQDLANSFKVLTKPREGGMRHIVVLLYACFTCGSLTYTGVDFLYFRRKFNFSDEEELINWYNHLRSYTALADVVSLFVVLPLMVRTLGFHDMTIVICAVSAQAAKSLIYFFAEQKNVIYTVIFFSIFSPLVTQPLRSSMTKIVGQSDVGAIFACVAAGQAISGFATPLYNKIYVATMDWNVGTVYLVPCGIFAIMLSILIYCLLFLKRKEWKNPTPSVSTTSYVQKARL